MPAACDYCHRHKLCRNRIARHRLDRLCSLLLDSIYLIHLARLDSTPYDSTNLFPISFDSIRSEPVRLKYHKTQVNEYLHLYSETIYQSHLYDNLFCIVIY